MHLVILMSMLLGIFSTTVMSYIAMATPIGPWIAPTLVLCSFLVYSCLYSKERLQLAIVYTTISASLGGIIATAFGFTFPTLYFLDNQLFTVMLAQPLYFVAICGSIAFIAGWYGIWIANVTEQLFLQDIALPFPIAQLIQKMITAQQQVRKALELALGFVSTSLFCMLQDGIFGMRSLIAKTFVMSSQMQLGYVVIPALTLDFWPMLWAIGFVTGHMIVMPLLVGSLSKIMIAQPVHMMLFPEMSLSDFILAFCSGMVVSGVVGGFGFDALCKMRNAKTAAKQLSMPSFLKDLDRAVIYEGCALWLISTIFLSYIGFSFVAQCYLWVCTFICAYQIVLIAGKIGLAQLGRFATFVLVPALFLFGLDFLQITVISVFVETCTGVVVDILCGRKVIALSGADQATGRWYQYLGLIISSITIGIIFWLLINHFQLGSPELFAQRSQARALLIHVKQFNYGVVFIGLLYGFALKQFKVSPMLVLGGLLMPINISIGLVLGGLATSLTKDPEQWYPFWSGVFAANSIWMLIQAMM